MRTSPTTPKVATARRRLFGVSDSGIKTVLLIIILKGSLGSNLRPVRARSDSPKKSPLEM